MIDRDLAESAAQLLSTAIGELIEDVHPLALHVAQGVSEDAAGVLRQTGEDVLALARAIMVLQRQRG